MENKFSNKHYFSNKILFVSIKKNLFYRQDEKRIEKRIKKKKEKNLPPNLIKFSSSWSKLKKKKKKKNTISYNYDQSMILIQRFRIDLRTTMKSDSGANRFLVDVFSAQPNMKQNFENKPFCTTRSRGNSFRRLKLE